MATSHVPRHLTARDEEILLALDHSPLTVQQLLKVSQTFPDHPFLSPRSVQDRLAKLRDAGWVCRWTYAVPTRGAAPDYYKLTLLGYRLIHGFNAGPPTKRAFSEIGIAFHHHAHSLAEFIVHSVVAAYHSGMRFLNVARENAARFIVGDVSLFPDYAFEIKTRDGRQFRFRVELDNGTERLRSDKDTESWQRKIRLYDQWQDRSSSRFRVLIVATRSQDRLSRILSLAGSLARNPHRSLFYGTMLDRYLAEANALHQPCFLDHRLSPTSLIPSPDAADSPHDSSVLTALRRTCLTLAVALCLSYDATWQTAMASPPVPRTLCSRECHLLKLNGCVRMS